jgi:uncharacterized protein YbaR (Trm112 family)
MNFKSISITLSALAFASVATAQTLFHDDWESYRPGTQDWQFVGGYNFGDFDVNFEAGETYPTVVEGPKDGVTPYSGNKMYDFRGSAIKGGRILAHSLNSKSTVNPIVDLSIRFAVPSSYSLKTLLYMGLRTQDFFGDTATGTLTFDMNKNTVKGFAVQAKPLVLARDTWNEVRVRVDWRAKRTSLFLNWQLLDSHKFSTLESQPPFRVEGLFFGVIAQENYSSQYPVDTGIPAMLVDDVRFEAVPEAGTWVGLSFGLSAIFVARRRKCRA